MALLATAVLGGCASQKETLKSETVQPSALSVSDVQKAFTAEGLALVEAPLGESSGMPVTLVSRGAMPLFSAIVYGPNSVSAPLGIRVSNSHLVVRVRNVLISYSAAATTAAEVQAAVERLRHSKTR